MSLVMKYKVIPKIILMTLSLSLLTGCSKKPLKESDDPKEILEKAAKVYAEQKLRASEIEKVYSYDDATEEAESTIIIYDAEKGVRQETTEYEMGFNFTTFHVKEGNDYYVYIQESSDGEEWIRYKEDTSDGESMYEYYVQGSDFSFAEEDGYYNVEYLNEGKSTVENVETIKIKIKADLGYEEEIEEGAEVTRESVLEENGWTEEEVALVDGFSEIIDDYVAANASIDESSIRYEQTVWVNAENYVIVKIESSTILDNTENSGEANLALEKFNNEYWKMEMIHNDLQTGVSKEDAVKALEEAITSLKEGSEEGEDYYEYYPSQTKETVTERFLSGDDIPELSELPDNYQETTEEDYYNSAY